MAFAWLERLLGHAPEGPAVRLVRPPFSGDFIECRCGVARKDDCACIKARPPQAGAVSGPLPGASAP